MSAWRGRYTPKEASRLLGISEEEVARLMEQHGVPLLPRKTWRSSSGDYQPVFCTHVIPEGYPERAVDQLRKLLELRVLEAAGIKDED